MKRIVGNFDRFIPAETRGWRAHRARTVVLYKVIFREKYSAASNSSRERRKSWQSPRLVAGDAFLFHNAREHLAGA